MRYFCVAYVLILASFEILAAPGYEEIIKVTTALKSNVESNNGFKKLSTLHKEVSKGVLQEKLIVVAILGARLHKDSAYFKKLESLLSKEYPSSEFVDRVSIKSLSDTCTTCDGARVTSRNCLTCKTTGKCRNTKCKGGKTIGMESVNGQFKEVQKNCFVCSGTGKCTDCTEGQKEVRCSPCRGVGQKYSKDLAVKTYIALLDEVLIEASVAQEKVIEVQKRAQGMVKIDGEWYTREQVAEMEKRAMEARRRADLAERKAMESAQKELMLKKGESLLSSVEKMALVDPDSLITSINSFLDDYPEYDKSQQLSQELNYCKLVKDARTLQKSGAISKAIKTYKKALKFRNSQSLQSLVKKLDENTIGL